MRVGVVAGLVVAGMGLSACGGAEIGGPVSEKFETKATPSAGSPATEVAGERVNLSVASFVLPEGPDFEEKVVSDDEKLEYRKWYTTYPGTDEASCSISLSVESEVGDNAAIVLLEEAKAMRETNLQTATMDPNAPEDVVGTVLKYAGVWETEDGKQKASSIARQWQTPGNTLIGISINANDDGPKQCDPEAIAATLEWSGQERPVGGAE